jgi:hypothetical protein
MLVYARRSSWQSQHAECQRRRLGDARTRIAAYLTAGWLGVASVPDDSQVTGDRNRRRVATVQLAALILVNAPFALVGGILAVYWTQST